MAVPVSSPTRFDDAAVVSYLHETGGKEVSYAGGQPILNRGEKGRAFYVILSGEVEIRLADGSDRTMPLTRMGPGSSFGEMALLRDLPVSADVVALSDVTVLEYPGDLFQAALADCEPLRERLITRLADNLQQTTAEAWEFFQRAEALQALTRTEDHPSTMVATLGQAPGRWEEAQGPVRERRAGPDHRRARHRQAVGGADGARRRAGDRGADDRGGLPAAPVPRGPQADLRLEPDGLDQRQHLRVRRRPPRPRRQPRAPPRRRPRSRHPARCVQVPRVDRRGATLPQVPPDSDLPGCRRSAGRRPDRLRVAARRRGPHAAPGGVPPRHRAARQALPGRVHRGRGQRPEHQRPARRGLPQIPPPQHGRAQGDHPAGRAVRRRRGDPRRAHLHGARRGHRTREASTSARWDSCAVRPEPPAHRHPQRWSRSASWP